MMRRLKPVLIMVAWLGVWQVLSMLVAQELLLVSPLATSRRLLVLGTEQEFWLSIGLSLWRIMLGFGAALILGSALALLAARLPLIHECLAPLFNVIKATPVASFIILALIWVKSAYLTTFIAFLMVLPLIYTNLHQGLCQVSVSLLEVGRVFGLSPWKTFKLIYLPSIMPYLLSSCTVGLGFAWKSGVAAEVIGLPNHSIGVHLYDAKVYLETADLFAWTFVIVLLSVLMEKVLLALMRWLSAKMKIAL